MIKGPWTVSLVPARSRGGTKYDQMWVFNADGEAVCEVDQEGPKDEVASNALLLTHAPDILDLLKKVVKTSAEPCMCFEDRCPFHENLELAERLIKRLSK